MPSAKRQRIRTNQALKRAAEEAAKKRKRRFRLGIIIAIVFVLALVAIYFASRPTKSAPTGKSTASTSTTAAKAKSTAALPCPPASGATTRVTSFPAAPPMCINPALHYTATVTTDVGTFVITLEPNIAPKTVNNFVYLARYRYFDGIIFHRVIPGFVVQGGDPTGTGTGGPGYTIPDELPKAGQYKIGTVAMANTGAPHTGGSQFFIVVGQSGTQLPPQYSIFGQVTSGMNVVQAIAADGSSSGTPTKVHKMISVTIQSS
ncbi:MAG: peptidylprolyl isomerase [Actinomycetota bacterium]|nr:peptidylprolyl isomerase [Actinomycetota bacterium]